MISKVRSLCGVTCGIFLFVSFIASVSTDEIIDIDRQRNISCWDSCFYVPSEKLVNCNNSNCTEIPMEVPSDTEILIMHNNNLTCLMKTNFTNLRNLTVLDVSYNRNLNETAKNTFEGLNRLQVLNMSYTNMAEEYPEGLFSPLSNLKVLNLTRIAQYLKFNYRAFENLTNLEALYLGLNRLQPFPSFYRKNDPRKYVPNLKILDLAFNDIPFMFNNFLSGLEKLEVLNLTSNRIRFVNSSLVNATSLKVLILDQNDLCRVDEYGFRSNSLESISFAKSINFELTQHRETVLEKIPKLKSLNMRGCLVSEEMANKSPFDYMKSLTSLDLQGSHIYESYLPRLIGNLKSLEHLSLTDNIIANLNGSVFEKMSGSLKSLHLSKLQLTTINITSLSPSVWRNLREIDLSHNPWNCDCNIMWFRKWLKATNATIINQGSENAYQCYAPETRKKQSVMDLPEFIAVDCFTADPDVWLDTVVLITSMSYLSALIGSLLHKYRWHVKYWYFVHKSHQRQIEVKSDNRHFEFDAFVSYCAVDLNWVKANLLRLEEEHGIRLCLHDRDWMPGRDIADNIVESIENSRKTVLIVSNAFAISQWCHFELAMVQTRTVEADRDNIILVILEEIDGRNITPRLRMQMQTKTYIEWTSGSETGQQLFWAKLYEALKQPTRPLSNPPIQEIMRHV